MTQHDKLRREFVRLLTVDGPTLDRRRKEYNQAIFIDPDDVYFGGNPAWAKVTLDMVLAKFDQAVKNVNKGAT